MGHKDSQVKPELLGRVPEAGKPHSKPTDDGEIRYDMVRYGSVQFGMIRYCTVRYDKVR